MSSSNSGPMRSGASIRMFDGLQRVLPPASCSGAFSSKRNLDAQVTAARLFRRRKRRRKSRSSVPDDDQSLHFGRHVREAMCAGEIR